jgi:PAS domain S-box-containing protein
MTDTRGAKGAYASVSRGLVVVLVAELFLAAVLRMQGALELLDGQPLNFHRSLQLVGLALAPLLALTCSRIYRLARRSDAEAESAQRRVADVLAVASEWIWTIDRDGNLIDSNEAVAGLLGYEPGDIVGTSSFRLMHPDSRAHLTAALATSATEGVGWTRRTSSWRHRDGSRRFLESSATPLFDATGGVTGFRGASRDVTFEAEAAEATAAAHRDRAHQQRRIEQVLSGDTPLTVVYQPIVRIADGRVGGIEALARFDAQPQHPPDVWFTEAEELGLGEQLEILAVRRAAVALGSLSSDQYLSLNVSAATLCSDSVLRFLLEPGVPSERIVFELTEHAIVGDYDELADQLIKLRRLGARLAVDDAGAGYASLRHILRLRPDFIKLDRAVTTSVDSDPVRRALTAAMVAFAEEVGALLIAEGVERPEELEALASVGVPYAQGYLLGRPGPLGDWQSNGLLRSAV